MMATHIPCATSGSYPVRAGNLLRPLIDGEAAFRRICEAIEAAQHSVWVTIAFLHETFRMPDDRGSLFDVLDRAVARGLDVRVLSWRPNHEFRQHYPQPAWLERRIFDGSEAQRRMLQARGSPFRVRWDRAHGNYCQHQKSWLIDAGEASEVAFVGGMNLNPNVIAAPGHVGRGQHHDVYLELGGPAASDVHHNFAQRWNEASERSAAGGTWGHDGDDDLAFPSRLSAVRGESLAQIQRTLHAGLCTDGRAVPGAGSYDIAGGERSILEQYLLAIGAARSAIYIENQIITVLPIVEALDAALQRGVNVVALVPADPEGSVRRARQRPENKALFDRFAALGRHDHFALAGIAGPDGNGGRANVYVHAKLMLVDDAWATIGSCNLHGQSLFGNAEMNASIWDPCFVHGLRCTLLLEHLGKATAGLDSREALRLYRRVACENRARRDAGSVDWQGLAFTLDPATYGT
jgi:cardiolipin synthase